MAGFIRDLDAEAKAFLADAPKKRAAFKNKVGKSVKLTLDGEDVTASIESADAMGLVVSVGGVSRFVPYSRVS